MSDMRRREFITVIGGAAAWPLAARAQQPAVPVVGFLSSRAPEDSKHLVAAFRRGLAEGGFVEGQNVAIEFRWARGQYDLLPAMAAELVSRRVDVLTTAGGEPSALAAKRATSTIPIVFGLGSDPISVGLVESPARRQRHRRHAADAAHGAETVGPAARPRAGGCTCRGFAQSELSDG